MPHTAHLPLHCSFDIVELDLKPPFVTQEALYNFSGLCILSTKLLVTLLDGRQLIYRLCKNVYLNVWYSQLN